MVIDTIIYLDEKRTSRYLASYDSANTLNCADLKSLIKSKLNTNYPVFDKDVIYIGSKQVKDNNEIIENISGIEYNIYYKTK